MRLVSGASVSSKVQPMDPSQAVREVTIKLFTGLSGFSTSGGVTIRTVNAGTAGVSGKLSLSSGISTRGSTGAITAGTGKANIGRGGSIHLTVGSGSSGSGGDIETLAGKPNPSVQCIYIY